MCILTIKIRAIIVINKAILFLLLNTIMTKTVEEQ